jgi:hypothetical protein
LGVKEVLIFGERFDLSPLPAAAALAIAIAVFLALSTMAKLWFDSGKHDYGHVPEKDRIFFEIVSDIIDKARGYAGIAAVILSEKTPGLKVGKDGTVVRIERDPIETITMLLLNYERYFHKRIKIPVRFGRRYKGVFKNLRIYEKYFKEMELKRKKDERRRLEDKKKRDKEAAAAAKKETFLEKVNKFKI